eukprot:5610126-Lingulodinium_polyedra.AAC.1
MLEQCLNGSKILPRRGGAQPQGQHEAFQGLSPKGPEAVPCCMLSQSALGASLPEAEAETWAQLPAQSQEGMERGSGLGRHHLHCIKAEHHKPRQCLQGCRACLQLKEGLVWSQGVPGHRPTQVAQG